MKNSVEFVSETRAIVTIEVTPAEFVPDYEKTIKETGKQVTIPGFRRGKAPRRVLEANLDKHALIDQAIQENLDRYYQEAINELELSPMSQPEVELASHPHMTGKDDDDSLKVVIRTSVRPEIILPNPADVTLTFDAGDVSDADIENELVALRERFASLTDVKRKAKEGDYVNIDMVAKVGDEEVDDVSGVSYRIGDGTMLEGQDEALTGAKAGDVVEFKATLKGGDHEGDEGDVTITVHSVKESVLPDADDDFAQMASEFDTIDELKDDLKKTLAETNSDLKLVELQRELNEELLKLADFPLPEGIVDQEVANHLKQEGKPEDDPHGDEVRPEIEEALKSQLLLDEYVNALSIDVGQDELLNFLVGQAQQYGMDPNQFIQAAAQTDQLGAFAGEVARNKALLSSLRYANVVDSAGNKVDIDELLGERPEGETDVDFAAQKKTRKITTPAVKNSDSTTAESDKAEPKKESAKKESAKKEPAKKDSAKKVADSDFDPAEHTIGEVSEYLDKADSAEKSRVIEAEKTGKARKGVLALADFDPAEHSVDEVIAYVEKADDAEKARVLQAEKNGKARKTLIAKIDG